jgi:phospholipid transport system substrate-binding protein
VITILNNKSLPLAAKKQQFRALIDQVADVPRVTSYVLGKYNRTITPAKKAEFASAFREFANGVYESRLGQYHGESLKVTGSTVRRPGDVVVTSQVVGGSQPRPVHVGWRVLKGDDGRWRAVDVEVAGVWLAITQQQDFVSTIDNAGGNIDVLIRQLRTQAARNNAGA